MNQILIIYPVFALVGLTFGIAIWMGVLRFSAVIKGDLSAKYYKYNRGDKVPGYLAKVSQNFDNLLELPILFYVASIFIYVIQQTDFVFLLLAWLYVITRFVHSFIHTSYNKVSHRMIPFISSSVILAGIWIKMLIHILIMN